MPFNFKKYYGQNFLVDHNIIDKIVSAITPNTTESFIEIGPGNGALTKEILPICKNITAIEIDKELVEYLRTYFIDSKKFSIIHKDILKVNINDISTTTPVRIFGNLPYNISTPILFQCISSINIIKDCTFMLQKEVAERICANYNTREYGRLSIMLQYYFIPRILFSVSANCFIPKPKVSSSIIHLTPRKNMSSVLDHDDFAMLVRIAFSARRKNIRNALKRKLLEKDLIDCKIEPNSRPENLSLEDFIRISNYYTENKK
ncbi:MAG: 16S rRNA (adenine(1518)-N(6)/adenine(1519)-N(6))-dimethyltransferase RsmA [Legionellales bacterium]|nr:16S rRNA (adenine(1518)-N(6)/adenine(1519)-N(6))-dimethyltransferase RsmA [Legionellales bacterium]